MPPVLTESMVLTEAHRGLEVSSSTYKGLPVLPRLGSVLWYFNTKACQYLQRLKVSMVLGGPPVLTEACKCPVLTVAWKCPPVLEVSILTVAWKCPPILTVGTCPPVLRGFEVSVLTEAWKCLPV